ncbi:autotransporter assembly complex family protein [Bartonella sp. HY038]|uniref:autotransporter assembly complex protein TamA n=1 Tax=Bartonella sp. HY038 TaxID=2759660 RepID=UPI00352CB453
MQILKTHHKLRLTASALTLLMGLSFACIVPVEAQAFDLFGIHLWGKKEVKVDPDMIGTPKYYEVEVKSAAGSPEEGESTAKDASSLVAEEDKAASGSAGLLARAKGDYNKILAALYAEGRYGGVISITIDGKEASDFPIDAEFPDHTKIVITVDSGPEYKFSRAAVHELAPPTNDPKDKVPLPVDQGYGVGDVAKSGTVFKAEALAVEGWRQQGYAKAKVTNREVVADHANNTIDAVIDIDQGRLAHLGPLTVSNISKRARMDSAFVAWMTGLKEGQEYDPDDIKKANKRLARLEVFRAANVREADEIEADGSLPLNLVLDERPPRRYGVGANYSTLDGAGFEAYWMHRNLFGRAERLRFDAKISGIGGSQSDSYNPQNYSYLLGTTFTKPGVFTPDTDFITSLKGEREVVDNYTATGVYLQTGFTHMFNDELSGRIYANAARIRSKDDYYGARNFTTMGLLGGLLYDNRNDKTDPSSGFYGEVVLEPVYEAEYGNFIGKGTVEGRTYYALDKRNRYVLAGRVKVGSIVGPDASQIPSNMLFFAGGGGSVRGYGYRNIGVKKETGDIVGGRSLVEGSLEARGMITESLGLVGFVDAGVVGENSYPDFDENTKIGAGVGVRYKTGLGPLRFDVAMPTKRESGDPKLGFYIGIGQAF